VGKTVIALAALALVAPAAQADAVLPPILRQVKFDQNLNAQVPLDAVFKDEAGRTVKLGDYFHGKPVVLVLAYFRCPMLCTEVLNGLVRAMLDVPYNAGREFEVLTVSFDARETPRMAAAKKKTYLERYGRPGAKEGWHFLTGQEDSIRLLADAVGFRFTYDPRNDQFAHASGIMILTPQGRVARYLYGIDYSPRDFKLGLMEASLNKIGSPVERAVLFFCFHYQPEDGKYGVIIMNFVRLGGVLTVVGIVVLVAVLLRHDKRRALQGVVKAG
jgi:protein SCO1/2